MRIALVSGYWNPLHVGHLAYMEAAKELADELWVIINSDLQVGLKGSVPFMNESDRLRIVSSLKVVDRVFLSVDTDRTVTESIREAHSRTMSFDEVIFVNGGDATAENVPEVAVCEELGIQTVFGVVPQIAESSKILAKVGVKR